MTPKERLQQLEVSIETWKRLPKADRERVLNTLFNTSDELKHRPNPRGFTAFDTAFSILVYCGPPVR